MMTIEDLNPPTPHNGTGMMGNNAPIRPYRLLKRDLLDGTDPNYKLNFILTLSNPITRDNFATLQNFFEDKDWQVRFKATQQLRYYLQDRSLQLDKQIRTLLDGLMHDPDPMVRFCVAELSRDFNLKL